MTGDDGSGVHTPKDFNECVSQEQLHNAKKEMQEVITEAVTDAIIDLKLGDIIERVDRRISKLTDRIDTLEARQPTSDDEDMVYDAQGKVEEAAT